MICASDKLPPARRPNPGISVPSSPLAITSRRDASSMSASYSGLARSVAGPFAPFAPSQPEQFSLYRDPNETTVSGRGTHRTPQVNISNFAPKTSPRRATMSDNFSDSRLARRLEQSRENVLLLYRRTANSRDSRDFCGCNRRPEWTEAALALTSISDKIMVDSRSGLNSRGVLESYLRSKASSGRFGELPTIIPVTVGDIGGPLKAAASRTHLSLILFT